MNWHIFKGVILFAIIGPPLAVHFSKYPIASQLMASLPATFQARVVSSKAHVRKSKQIVDGRSPSELPGEVLHFWSHRCPVSIETEAKVRRLRQQGYKIRSINIRFEQQKSSFYHIDCTPTFIYREGGRTLRRVELGLSAKKIIALCRGE